ncbi:unnamed protein product [Mucor hiemalis]
MSSPLVTRTAFACRSVFAKPALLNTIRFSSSQNKDVIHSENQPVLSVENLSGAPESLLDRQVRIFKPTRTPVQQGKNGTRLWRIDFDILEDGNRWENPLMGWASSSDFQQALTMKFLTKEDAITFAEKQGNSERRDKFEKNSMTDIHLFRLELLCSRTQDRQIRQEGLC